MTFIWNQFIGTMELLVIAVDFVFKHCSKNFRSFFLFSEFSILAEDRFAPTAGIFEIRMKIVWPHSMQSCFWIRLRNP